MTMHLRSRRLSALAGTALLLCATPVLAEDAEPWSPDGYRSGGSSGYAAPRNDAPSYGSANGGYSANRGNYGANGNGYAPPGGDTYARNGGAYAPSGGNYGSGDTYAPDRGYGANDAYAPGRDGYAAGGDAYSPSRGGANDSFTDPGQPVDDGGRGGYGQPYAPPPEQGAYGEGGPPPPENRGYYEQNEIIAAGHGFFGAISQGLGQAVEYAFKSQGRPNGYILGEDAGGAFVVGLRYGEGKLFTKDAGDHKVFWQGPSVGYDAGAEGSKAMVLVYNLHDPSEIYNRFGGVQGAAYLVGGLSVQFQKYGDVTLAVIRSGVGVRLGANVGYLKYTRAPTWNPL